MIKIKFCLYVLVALIFMLKGINAQDYQNSTIETDKFIVSNLDIGSPQQGINFFSTNVKNKTGKGPRIFRLSAFDPGSSHPRNGLIFV